MEKISKKKMDEFYRLAAERATAGMMKSMVGAAKAAKARNEKNAEKAREAVKKYNHSEKGRRWRKRYYRENKQTIWAKKKARLQNDPAAREKLNAYARKWQSENYDRYAPKRIKAEREKNELEKKILGNKIYRHYTPEDDRVIIAGGFPKGHTTRSVVQRRVLLRRKGIKVARPHQKFSDVNLLTSTKRSTKRK